MEQGTKILQLLKQETAAAMGCTEPAAVALACAHARAILSEEIKSAQILVSPNILKNGMGVGIPGTGLVGLDIAAGLGLIIGKPESGLEVLSEVDADKVKQARELIQRGILHVQLKQTDDKIWIEVLLESASHRSRAIIRWRHNWLYRLELDDQVLIYNDIDAPQAVPRIDPGEFKLRDHYDFSRTVELSSLQELDLGITLNRAIAEYGLREAVGISVGKAIMQQINSGVLGDDMHHYAMALTAAATDARMGGCPLPVISNTGSGNQGLSITLPIIAVAEKRACSEEQLLRALTMGHLVSVHIKYKVGVLSCLCGCLSAACGAACGIISLLGGDFPQMEYAIKNMIGNTAGMVCDGAKEGCSLKVATNTSAAVQAALLALSGICISANDGIITGDIEDTISNLAEFVNQGMNNADQTILNIMINKK
ncbi:MAG TPA: L-serine ammonia-lyase, iron-sulfur-dependent, subunit alpha [Candidatus Cloacimonadota bacterium]|nr:L-serine ammonia-lyase, iron-sulfur-dependent, subunit alpha [Candidatus Cloacimonadota bacterium]